MNYINSGGHLSKLYLLQAEKNVTVAWDTNVQILGKQKFKLKINFYYFDWRGKLASHSDRLDHQASLPPMTSHLKNIHNY